MNVCSGCCKEVHESAKNCPHCGMAQFTKAGVLRVIVMFIVWVFLIEFGVGFIVGIFALLIGGQQAVQSLQEEPNKNILAMAGVGSGFIFSTILTIYGSLPGARTKRTQKTESIAEPIDKPQEPPVA